MNGMQGVVGMRMSGFDQYGHQFGMQGLQSTTTEIGQHTNHGDGGVSSLNTTGMKNQFSRMRTPTSYPQQQQQAQQQSRCYYGGEKSPNRSNMMGGGMNNNSPMRGNQRGGRKPFIQNRFQQRTKNTLGGITEGQQMINTHNSNYAIDLEMIHPRQLTGGNVTLADCIEKEVIEKLARDQYGSRFTEQQLESASEEDKHSVLQLFEDA